MKLSFKDVTFTIHDGVTICQMTAIYKINGEILHSFTIYGTAKCNKTDKFDFNKARLISSARAEKAAYKYILKKYNEANKRLLNKALEIEDFIKKSKSVIEHNTEYLKTICK